MHGDQDTLCPLSQSELLYRALAAAGAEVDLRVLRGAWHGFVGPEVEKAVGDFFDRHLRSAADTGARAAPAPLPPGKDARAS